MPPTWRAIAVEAEELMAKADAWAADRAAALEAEAEANSAAEAGNNSSSSRVEGVDAAAEVALPQQTDRPASRAIPPGSASVPRLAVSQPLVRPFSAKALPEKGPATQTPPESRPTTALQTKGPSANPALAAR